METLNTTKLYPFLFIKRDGEILFIDANITQSIILKKN